MPFGESRLLMNSNAVETKGKANTASQGFMRTAGARDRITEKANAREDIIIRSATITAGASISKYAMRFSIPRSYAMIAARNASRDDRECDNNRMGSGATKTSAPIPFRPVE